MPPHPPPWCNPRKGRDKILPSGNLGYRVVVPDFIGFGKSDKYTNANNYTHELHMASIRLLLDHLGLRDPIQ